MRHLLLIGGLVLTVLPAAAFNPNAIVAVGEIYGGAKDYRRARAYYELAGANGTAQFHLGEFYAKGWGGPLDLKAAQRCYERAAEAGHSGAQLALGRMLFSGDLKGIPPDAARARHWYGQAAAGRSAEASQAQLMLGQMAMTGSGGPRDWVLARQMLEKAAESDDQRIREAARYYLNSPH